MKRGREPAGWPHIREGTGARPENPGKGYFRGGFLYTARPSPACRRALHPAAPGERREKRRAASHEPQAASRGLFACFAETLRPLRENLLTTENTKKTQRKATSYELRATGREKKATGGQENLFVALCETSVSSPEITSGQVVVEENLNTKGKAASCKPRAASCMPFAPLRLCVKKILGVKNS